MPKILLFSMTGATLCMLLMVGGSAAGEFASGGTKIGIDDHYPDSIAVGRAVGVGYLREGVAIEGGNRAQIARIQAEEAAGFRLNIQFTNTRGNEEKGVKPGPVIDDKAFEGALAAELDATHPELITIQNEEDGLQFWSGTPEQYLHELGDAVVVAHAKGYRISNGGLTWTGVKLAYWRHLWLSGQHQAADRFAREALGPEKPGQEIIGDLPDSADPSRPILGQNALLRAKLARVEFLLAAYPRTGIDYLNFHWFQTGAKNLREVATWLGETTGLPVICNAMGQFDDNPERVTSLLSTAVALHMPYVFWFAQQGHGGGAAVGLTDESGALRPGGIAFKAFVAAHR
jgi:hypothetical protein